jgi:FtsH-binding integral membrane protein
MALTVEPDPNTVVTHPNRDAAASKATRSIVLLLLVVSAVLVFVLVVGAHGASAGATPLEFFIGLLYVLYTYLVLHWRSGALPIAAATAVIAGVFAAVSVNGWFDRDGTGFSNPVLPNDVMGLLVLAFAIVQIPLLVFALRGFQQQWQVELEMPREQAEREHHPYRGLAT